MVAIIDVKHQREEHKRRFDFVSLLANEEWGDSMNVYDLSSNQNINVQDKESREGVFRIYFEADVDEHVFSVYSLRYFDKAREIAEKYENEFGVHARLRMDYQWD